MRYIKARTMVNAKGRKYPEGLEHARAVLADRFDAETDLWIVPDDINISPNSYARPADLPMYDNPGSPLHGMRLVPVVMSGMPDCVLDETGRMVPAVEE